jgi:hypothetical protein
MKDLKDVKDAKDPKDLKDGRRFHAGGSGSPSLSPTSFQVLRVVPISP